MTHNKTLAESIRNFLESGDDLLLTDNDCKTIIKALEQEPCKAGLQHLIKSMLDWLPSVNPQEPKANKYEYHIDHTDCIWHGSDSGCPVTCSQYRDGWNDAMEYIYKNGKGYQPYRRMSEVSE